MPKFDEQEHLVREFRANTGASDTHARDVLMRNRWCLADSYKEVERMCISSNRASCGPTVGASQPFYPHQEGSRPTAAPSKGGMEGGVGPAVSLQTAGTRSSARVVPVSGGDWRPQVHAVEGLKVALPPVRAPVERVIPIQVDGGRTVFQPQTTGMKAAPPTAGVSRISLDEKVVPSQPIMVPPKMNSNKAASQTSTASEQSPTAPLPLEGCPRLKRGFSSITENEVLVTAARCSVLQDIKEDNHSHMFQTFMLPDFSVHPDDFRAFLVKELIESSTLNSLESAGRLNWWAHQGLCQRLFPMATTGDGNCLLHAASLSMWGIHDRLLTLRNAVHDTLTSSKYKDSLYRRWRWQQTQVNLQSGLVFSEEEWDTEWDNILRLASPCPRSAPDSGVNTNSCCDSPLTSSSSSSEAVVYESLEEFHVFVLAHVLQRPIIVVADTILRDANGEALAPIPFGGIYLPLERPRDQCCSSPLLLTYDAAHFSALVPMQHSDSSSYDVSVPLAIPVVDPELKLLPLHFCYDPGPKFVWGSGSNKEVTSQPCLEDRLNLLKAYMDVLYLSPDTVLIGSPALTSRQSSSGSEDGGGSVNSTLSKEKRKDGKPSTVAKQFGSLGKTMGKKLKNLGNNLGPTKAGSKVGGQEGQLVSLGGGLTHSTKVITALATTGGEENGELVPCAKLDCECDETRDTFIENYLKNAHKRFLQEQELKRQRGEEQRSRVALHSLAAMPAKNICHTPGCKNYALPNISLCDPCASQQQWQQGGTLERSRLKVPAQPSGYNTFPGRNKAPTGLPSAAPPANSEIYKCGKSKFYTPTHPEPPLASSTLQVLRQGDRQQSLSTGNVARPLPAPRPRSPSPDYDNVQRGKEANPKCATVGCDFYGSRETGNLCSGCYRKKTQHLPPARSEKTTKL